MRAHEESRSIPLVSYGKGNTLSSVWVPSIFYFFQNFFQNFFKIGVFPKIPPPADSPSRIEAEVR